MLSRVAAFLMALACSCIPARAADAPASNWKYANPFCGAVAEVAPIGTSGRYGLGLFAEQGTTIAAHVTLVSITDAYDVAVPDTNLLGPVDDRELEPVVVSLPAADSVKYFFVDSFAVDRGASVTCPSYVFPIGDTLSGSPDGAPSLAATHLQSLGKLACAKMYRPAESGKDAGGMIGHFGNQPLSTEYRVFVDSNGHAAGEKLLASSGVEGVDSSARGDLQGHQYVPAQFLCTPVVGEVDIRMDYVP